MVCDFVEGIAIAPFVGKKHKHKSKSSSSWKGDKQREGFYSSDLYDRPSEEAHRGSNEPGNDLESVLLHKDSQPTGTTNRFGSIALRKFLQTIDLGQEEQTTTRENPLVRESSFMQIVKRLRLHRR